ncbi:MAG: 4-hydroxy-tetrahydrodipicolinate synthase [Verrucomicrobiaceae bacterium]|nr:4-hydroxy-tetrahydrodipicolinate synthase [Verrucomicrobiaceae bacterium]
MNMQNFSGVWTALVTPMTELGVDYDALKDLVEAQIKGGVSGLVSVGTTGESPTLDPVEHIVTIRKTIEFAAGRVPVLAGTGANCTKEAVHLTREADEAGADGFLVVAPYYNKPSQEGVFLHMSEIAKCTKKPIMLYSIPGRCGIEISNDTAVRLANAYPNFKVMKEAGGKVEKVADLTAKANGIIDVLSGDDGLTVDFMKAGATGVVSVASNLVPEAMVELVNLCKDKNWEKAEALNDKLAGFFKALFIEPNPVPAKTAMAMAGMIANPYVRLPLCKMAESNLEILKAELKKIGLI